MVVTGPYVTRERADSKSLSTRLSGCRERWRGVNQLSRARFALTSALVQFSGIDSTGDPDGLTKPTLSEASFQATERWMGSDVGRWGFKASVVGGCS